ncbi:cysteine proteinase [Auricularia subglabra TFB-10046 SS5]|uniref:Cysteine proteinase n=1 Tax=Auricularia subglabra (strain TFB-10046 / SS5) TaxID=717982 RepID=J0WN05_AURST|nr:cysteine proteinase [Auricularia subglabra TFB-10046 SS5]
MAEAEACARARRVSLEFDDGGERTDAGPVVVEGDVFAAPIARAESPIIGAVARDAQRGLPTPPTTPHRDPVSHAEPPDAAYPEDLWSDAGESDDEMGSADELDLTRGDTEDDPIDLDGDDVSNVDFVGVKVEDAHIDHALADIVRADTALSTPAVPHRALQRAAGDGFKRITASPQGLKTLEPYRRLNDEVISAGFASLAAEYPLRAGKVAIFQTYEYDLWRDSHKIPRVAGLLSRSEYWLRDVILVPVYDKDEAHWMLAVVYTQYRLIDFYDSLGSKRRWDMHAECVANLLTGLQRHATTHKRPLTWNTTSDKWKTTRLVELAAPHQENVVDCGVWVLAVAAAVLRGWRSTALPPDLIPAFRTYLLRLICKWIPPLTH